MSSQAEKRGLDGFILSLLALSVALNVYLGARVLRPPVQPGEARPKPLERGAIPGPVIGRDATGRERAVRFEPGDGRLLVYAFSSTCKWCAANARHAASLFEQAPGRFRAVALCLDAAGSDCSGVGVPRQAVLSPSPETRDNYRLAVVPQTVLLSAKGQVERTWNGAYEGSTKAEIEEALEVDLTHAPAQPEAP